MQIHTHAQVWLNLLGFAHSDHFDLGLKFSLSLLLFLTSIYKFFSLCLNEATKQVSAVVRYISYSVILFFLPSQNAWVSTFEYRPGLSHSFQVSAEAEIYNPITVLGSCRIFSFVFFFFLQTGYECIFCTVNSRTVSFPVTGLVLCSLI